MSDPANPFQPMLNAWMKAQSDYFAKVAGNGQRNDQGQSAADPSDPFAGLREQAAAFMAQAGIEMPDMDAFQDMFDPSVMAGMSTAQGAGDIAPDLAAFMAMPGLGDLADIERTQLHTTAEWQQFQTACRDIQNINAAAWHEAWAAFQSEVGPIGDASQIPTDMGERWFAILNDKLTGAMATPTFLSAQAEVIRTGAAYKSKEREIVETWCKAHSIPTRSEVDALHETITELRREIAALK